MNIFLFGQDNSSWKKVKDSDDIVAYVQKLPSSQLKKVKVETVIKATLSEIITIIKDAENHKNWVFFNNSAEIIDVTDDLHWKYYGYTDSPWPVNDRDFITSVTLCQNKIDHSITITSIALPDYLPEKEDCVRIRNLTSVWYLEPRCNGDVYTTLEIEVDIGGKIPQWLVNMAITKGPISTMTGLIEVLDSNNYNHPKLVYIKELQINSKPAY